MHGPVAAAAGDVSVDCLEGVLEEGVLEEEKDLEFELPEGGGGEGRERTELERDSKERDSSSHKISNMESKWPKRGQDHSSVVFARPDQPGARSGTRSGCNAPVLLACIYLPIYRFPPFRRCAPPPQIEGVWLQPKRNMLQCPYLAWMGPIGLLLI